MAKRRSKKRTRKKNNYRKGNSVNVILLVALLLCLFSMTPFGKSTLEKLGIESGIFYENSFGKYEDDKNDDNGEVNNGTSIKVDSQNSGNDVDGNLKFDFIDVGQGDSTLVTTPSGNRILIDTGTRDTQDELADFLRENGVETLDYLILTHPHSDHIGGAEKVINSFDVKNVIMPDAVNTGSTFERTVLAIQKEKQKGCKVYSAHPRDSYTVDGCDIKLHGPAIKDDDNLNNTSIVMTLNFRDFTALFTGDAEKEAEKAVLDLDADIDCDLYKVGHHGSSTSSCDELLSAASPSVAIISCGKDNSYGHPHAAVTKALKDREIEYYITAKSGNITVLTDGKTYSVIAEK